jgi:hypothetical protein
MHETQMPGARATSEPLEDFVRLPGLFRRREFAQVIEPGWDFHIEDGGKLDGIEVYAVYRRSPKPSTGADAGIPVGIVFDGDDVALRARLLPISAGEPLMAVLVLDESPRGAATLTRVREHLARSTSQAGGGVRDAGAATHMPVGGR